MNIEKIEKIASSDTEMKIHLLGQVFKVGDEVKKNEEYGKIVAFPFKFYGRLGNPGCKPGKYRDRSSPLVSFLAFKDADVYRQRLEALPDDWHFINLEDDYLEPLPETKFIESDIVRLVDEKHENYTENADENQFTVYRIKYSLDGEAQYHLRCGETLFFALESQLESIAQGPVRVYQGGQPLLWRDLRSEAEFHLLIGNFKRSFNPITNSYKWAIDQARQVISLGKAHGIQKINDSYNLITFLDERVGREVAASNLILTA
jgi:hypothetical protein